MKKVIIIILIVFVIGVLLEIGLRLGGYRNQYLGVVTNSDSMEDVIQADEVVQVDTKAYLESDPQRYDYVYFKAPEKAGCPEGAGCNFIKRVIALPNETISVKDGMFIVDGEEVNKAFDSDESMLRTIDENNPMKLASDEYFIVGNNMDKSSDSRAWGPIKRSDILGKAIIKRKLR